MGSGHVRKTIGRKGNVMFSLKEKQYIASRIEKILLELNHPELPRKQLEFHLHVEGREAWSWADIKPNWTFDIDNPPKVNPFNEVARDVLKKREGEQK